MVATNQAGEQIDLATGKVLPKGPSVVESAVATKSATAEPTKVDVALAFLRELGVPAEVLAGLDSRALEKVTQQAGVLAQERKSVEAAEAAKRTDAARSSWLAGNQPSLPEGAVEQAIGLGVVRLIGTFTDGGKLVWSVAAEQAKAAPRKAAAAKAPGAVGLDEAKSLYHKGSFTGMMDFINATLTTAEIEAIKVDAAEKAKAGTNKGGANSIAYALFTKAAKEAGWTKNA